MPRPRCPFQWADRTSSIPRLGSTTGFGSTESRTTIGTLSVAVEFVATGARIPAVGAFVATGRVLGGSSASTAFSTTDGTFALVVDGGSFWVLSVSVGVLFDEALVFWAREFCFGKIIDLK